MITFDPITLHRGYADWGLPMSHVITRPGADPYDRNAIIADIPSVQPYCMGASAADIEYADTQLAYATLFAAAPDLLKVAEFCDALLERIGYLPDSIARDGIRTAIAKAYGKETT